MDAVAWALLALVLGVLALDARGRVRQRQAILAALARIEGVYKPGAENTWIGEVNLGGVPTSIRVVIIGGGEKHPEIEGITWRRP